jgi:hypothetical protein
MAMGRPAFYMNRTVHAGLSIQAMDRAQNVLCREPGSVAVRHPRLRGCRSSEFRAAASITSSTPKLAVS